MFLSVALCARRLNYSIINVCLASTGAYAICRYALWRWLYRLWPSFLRSFWTAVFENLSSDIFRKYKQLIFILTNFGKIFKEPVLPGSVGVVDAALRRIPTRGCVDSRLSRRWSDVTEMLWGVLQNLLQ